MQGGFCMRRRRGRMHSKPPRIYTSPREPGNRFKTRANSRLMRLAVWAIYRIVCEQNSQVRKRTEFASERRGQTRRSAPTQGRRRQTQTAQRSDAASGAAPTHRAGGGKRRPRSGLTPLQALPLRNYTRCAILPQFAGCANGHPVEWQFMLFRDSLVRRGDRCCEAPAVPHSTDVIRRTAARQSALRH